MLSLGNHHPLHLQDSCQTVTPSPISSPWWPHPTLCLYIWLITQKRKQISERFLLTKCTTSQDKLGMYTQYTEYNFSVNEAGVTGSGSPAFHGLRLSLVGVLTPSPQRASSQREFRWGQTGSLWSSKRPSPVPFFFFLIKSPDIFFKNEECQSSYKNIGIF